MILNENDSLMVKTTAGYFCGTVVRPTEMGCEVHTAPSHHQCTGMAILWSEYIIRRATPWHSHFIACPRQIAE